MVVDRQINQMVIGASGQLGRELVKEIEVRGNLVIDVDDLDLTDSDSILELARRMKNPDCDFVYFLAFDVGASKYLRSSEADFDFIDNNMLIMHNVFNAIRLANQARPTPMPFIFTSTHIAAEPKTTYAVLKALGERYTKSLGGVSTRLWNIYGVQTPGLRSNVITDLIEQAKQGDIKLFTKGTEERQFMYVCDCSAALFALYKEYDTVRALDPIVDVSNFNWVSVYEVAKTIANIFGRRVIRGSEDRYNRSPPPNFRLLQYYMPQYGLKKGIECLLKQTNALPTS